MSNQSHPRDGTAGYVGGHYNDNDNDTDTISAQYAPAYPIMNTGGNWNHYSNDYYHSGTVFATGGATGLVPGPGHAYLEGYGDPGRTTLESRMALQSSQHSESWNSFTAVQQPLAAMHGHEYLPLYPNTIQVPGYPGLHAFGNSASHSRQTGNNSNRSTQCEHCGSTLSAPRELQRHMRTVHGTAWYMCKCVHSTARKDNYLRHLKSCKMKDKTGPSFFCICGTEHNNLEEHSNHVKDCKQRR